MAATATAPRTRRRTSGARRKPPAPRTRDRARKATARRGQRRGITPAAGFAIPAAAVGRTAVAVGGLADSGLMVRLTRSRLWIGLVGALLVGIVALNVYALALSADGSKVALQSEELTLENSALRAKLTEGLSNDRIRTAAARLGLAAPAPDTIRYLKATDADAKAAAKRLLGGELTAGAVASEPSAEAASAVAPIAVDPVAVEPAAIVPATPVVPVDPARTAALAPPPVAP
ncbi:MAG: hypothetical protein ACR2OC_11045 [Solirubrobacterales bacterium]